MQILQEYMEYIKTLTMKGLIAECASPTYRCHVESARIQQHVTSFHSHQHRLLWKSNVVADGNSNFAVGSIENGNTVARRQGVALLESDLPWHVDVE